MDMRPGDKQAEVGVIPADWRVVCASDVCSRIQDGTHFSPRLGGNDYLYITSKNIRFGYLDISSALQIDAAQHRTIYKRCDVKNGDLLLTKDGANTGNAALNTLDEEFSLLSSVAFLRFDPNIHCAAYFLQQILTSRGQHEIQDAMAGNAITRLTLEKIKKLRFLVPPTWLEQKAIAEALSDTDALIESLDQLIAKKRHLKQGAMQELLQAKEGWVEKCIAEIADCLDNLRIPLNDSERTKMKGDYPYCGANGVLDYINDYCVDDSVILIAEDGGYFDEHMTRPIAYRMSGKCWVNNHAHILKAKTAFEQDFLFYSLVHKNILSYLASGTRAKLNKSELNKITIQLPATKPEQTAIAKILSDMDAEIAALEEKIAKAHRIKLGMMQELLTGRIRLV